MGQDEGQAVPGGDEDGDEDLDGDEMRVEMRMEMKMETRMETRTRTRKTGTLMIQCRPVQDLTVVFVLYRSKWPLSIAGRFFFKYFMSINTVNCGQERTSKLPVCQSQL